MLITPEIYLIPVLAAGYAELHYHLPWLYPLYFRRQPEIIADLPHRLDRSRLNYLPLLIIIKDAHLFPIKLHNLSVSVSDNDHNRYLETFDLDIVLDKPWFSRIIPLDISSFAADSEVFTSVTFNLTCRNKKISAINDNFAGISRQPFRTFLAANALNLPPGWMAGDPHYHSYFTSDQVEFGADIASTRLMANALGLSWFCVTDHSYDLDDSLDDYTRNDPTLPKWEQMKKECSEYSSHEIRIIAAEEISIGNSRDQNVHVLALNQKDFIPGHGDSAEVWGKNLPQHKLTEIPQLKNTDSLFIAAHPFDKVPLAQKLTLRRGNWSIADFHQSGIYLLQLINSDEPDKIAKKIATWTAYLLQGEIFFILAGNDAHGNFNIMRQISFPFLKICETRKQIFGRWMTIIESPENDPLKALQAGRMIVSNGPFISFYIHQLEDKWQSGETCPLRHGTVQYDVLSTPEFGEIDTIFCYRGDIDTGKEFRFPVACPVNIALPPNGYIRMSVVTTKGFTAFTNPIFTQH
ncbi:MAG: hypothetical protein K9M99_10540 [Candidatus Cloacimonetes bacterium]|nr:hypothetical protein [Candidatus Cloacimonadota bacterium]